MSGTHLPALPQRDVPNSPVAAQVLPAGVDRKGLVVSNVLPAILTSKPNIVGLLAAFRRRWRIATGLGFLVAVIAASVAWYVTSPLSYTVCTTVRVEPEQPRILFPTSEGRIDLQTYQRAQIGRVKSRFVLNTAFRDPKVAQLAIVRQQPDPIEWLSKDLQVDFSTSPEIMRISIIGKDSEALITLLDAIREAYLREVVNKEHNGRLLRLEKLKELYSQQDDSLKKQRKLLRELAEPLGSKDPKVLAMHQQFAMTHLSNMQQERFTYQSQLRRLELEAAAKEDQAKVLQEAVIPKAVIEEGVKKDPIVVGYEKEIERLKQYLEAYEETTKYPEKDATYKEKKTALAALQKSLESRRANLVPTVTEQARAQRQRDFEKEQIEQQEKIAMLKKLDTLLETQIRELEGQSKIFGKQSLDLEGHKEEIEQVEQLWRSVGAEVQRMSVEIMAPDRVTPTEDPAYATKRDGIGIKAALGAGLGSFCFVVFGISFLEFRARRLAGVEDVSHGLRLPVIGMMPRLRSRDGRALPQSSNSQAAYSQQLFIESVDTARALIVHATQQNALRVVMITSAISGEGKTMLAAHLSASLARAGWRALLVDADFRRPSLQTVFGLTGEAGLSEVLRGEADIREVMQPGPMEGLSVISAGSWDSRSMQALAQGALRGLFDQVKGEFDLIIVDSAPVLPVVDSQLIVQAVDGVILSVLRDVSRLPLIHAACERLSMFQVGLLGVVVHGADGETYGLQYPYHPVPAAKTAPSTKPEEL